MALPILRPLSFGEILDGAFTLYRRNFVTFGLTTLIPTVGIIIGFFTLGSGYVDAMTSGDPLVMMTQMLTGLWKLTLLFLAGALVMWPALTREVAQAYTGQPTSLADGFAAGARAALPLFGAAVLTWIAMIVTGFGAGIVLSMVMMAFGAMGNAMGVVGMALAFLGYCAFVLAFAALLFAVVPAVVVEGAGPLQALERSFTLARDALGRVVGVMTVAILIAYLPMLAVMALTGWFARMMDPGALGSGELFITQQVLGMSVGILTTPFLASVIVLLYFDRRVRTEALDVQMMTDSLALAGD
ncbi:MAG TPA: hypothetical protein VEQ60_31370 [Longimicrobium sp.]|nr:hypothetical protein [Longimicrobium sp.]